MEDDLAFPFNVHRLKKAPLVGAPPERCCGLHTGGSCKPVAEQLKGEDTLTKPMMQLVSGTRNEPQST